MTRRLSPDERSIETAFTESGLVAHVCCTGPTTSTTTPASTTSNTATTPSTTTTTGTTISTTSGTTATATTGSTTSVIATTGAKESTTTGSTVTTNTTSETTQQYCQCDGKPQCMVCNSSSAVGCMTGQGQLQMCPNADDVCQTRVIQNIKGVVIHYSTGCSRPSSCTSFSNLTCSFSPNVGYSCDQCHSKPDSCFCPNYTCPCKGLPQCYICNGSSETDCKKNQILQTCSHVDDVCRTDVFYNIKGVVVNYTMSCERSLSCTSFDGLVCSSTANGYSCNQCRQNADNCLCNGGCSCEGYPQCFACDAKTLDDCERTQTLVTCPNKDDVCLLTAYVDVKGNYYRYNRSCSQLQNCKTISPACDSDGCCSASSDSCLCPPKPCTKGQPQCYVCNNTAECTVAKLSTCPNVNDVCKTVMTSDPKGNIMVSSRSCATYTSCLNYGEEHYINATASYVCTLPDAGNCKIPTCDIGSPYCPTCNNSFSAQSLQYCPMQQCNSQFATCQTYYSVDLKGNAVPGSFGSQCSEPSSVCVAGTFGMKEYLCNSPAASCAPGLCLNGRPACPTCIGVSSQSNARTCPLQHCQSATASCLISYDVDQKGNVISNSWSARCNQPDEQCLVGACVKNANGTQTCNAECNITPSCTDCNQLYPACPTCTGVQSTTDPQCVMQFCADGQSKCLSTATYNGRGILQSYSSGCSSTCQLTPTCTSTSTSCCQSANYSCPKDFEKVNQQACVVCSNAASESQCNKVGTLTACPNVSTTVCAVTTLFNQSGNIISFSRSCSDTVTCKQLCNSQNGEAQTSCTCQSPTVMTVTNLATTTTTGTTTTTKRPTTSTTTTSSPVNRILYNAYSCIVDDSNPCRSLDSLLTFGHYYPTSEPTQYIQCGIWDVTRKKASCSVKTCPDNQYWDSRISQCGLGRQPTCIGLRPVCSACLLAKSESDCGYNGYQEDCSSLQDPVNQITETFDTTSGDVVYSSRCVERKFCTDSQLIINANKKVQQTCKPVRCLNNVQSCPITHTPVCVTCEINLGAVSFNDCLKRGSRQACDENKPVCVVKRYWSKSNGDADGELRLIWTQGCAEASSCSADWVDWPYNTEQFNYGVQPQAFQTIDTACLRTSCEPPETRVTFTMWIRCNIDYDDDFDNQYSAAWWSLRLQVTTAVQQWCENIDTFLSAIVTGVWRGSTVLSVDLVFNDTVTEASLDEITNQVTRGLMSAGNVVEYNSVLYTTTIDYVFDRQIPFANGTLQGNITAKSVREVCANESSGLCLNNGMCIQDQENFDVPSCHCVGGFSGSYCEIVAASATSEEVFLIASLSSLLTLIAIGLVIVVALFIYYRIKSTLDKETDSTDGQEQTNATITTSETTRLRAAPTYGQTVQSFLDWRSVNSDGDVNNPMTLHRDRPAYNRIFSSNVPVDSNRNNVAHVEPWRTVCSSRTQDGVNDDNLYPNNTSNTSRRPRINDFELLRGQSRVNPNPFRFS